MKAKLKRYILRLLNEMDGVPLTTAALVNDVKTTYQAALNSEIDDVIKELESGGYLSGNRNKVTLIISWTLTDSGAHQAKQL